VFADALSDLEKAHGAYVAHKYGEAEARLRALLDTGAPQGAPLKDADSVADARMYLGAVLLAEGKQTEAQSVFERLVLDKPDYQPDSLRVSLQATDALVDARARLREKLASLQMEQVRQAQEEKARADAERQKAALRLATLEKLASEQVIVEHHSRWEALLPFGVGQFQNGQETLGWTLLSAQSLLLLGSIGGAAVTLYDAGQASDMLKRRDSTAASYQSRAHDAAIVGDVFAAGCALVAAVGIVHAQATFVPKVVEVRTRAVPALSLSPLLEPAGGREGMAGAVLGVRGRF
jgi:hypothetical protein